MIVVRKNTTSVIVGDDKSDDETLLRNALNCGYTAEQVEILTQAEYDARKALEPQPIPQPTLEDYVLELEFRLSIVELGL